MNYCDKWIAGVILFVGVSLPFSMRAQSPDTLLAEPLNVPVATSGPEIFTRGFVDLLSGGQVNAAARLVRLYIGDQQGFSIPISIYTGVAAETFVAANSGWSLGSSNQRLINQYLDNNSGLINISSEGLIALCRKAPYRKTSISYQAGERILSGYRVGPLTDPLAGMPVNFLNTLGSLGLFFQSAAWDRHNIHNVGLAWLSLRLHGSYSDPRQLQAIFPGISTDGLYLGYSLAVGVSISRLIDTRITCYKYMKAPEYGYVLPVYQFSFNYSLKN